jgi:hypothetical protein
MLFNSIGTVRRYPTRQIVDDNQALGLVISTVARGMVSSLAESFAWHRSSSPKRCFFCFRILMSPNPLTIFYPKDDVLLIGQERRIFTLRSESVASS